MRLCFALLEILEQLRARKLLDNINKLTMAYGQVGLWLKTQVQWRTVELSYRSWMDEYGGELHQNAGLGMVPLFLPFTIGLTIFLDNRGVY